MRPLKFANCYVLLDKETHNRVLSATAAVRKTRTTSVRDDLLLEDGDFKRGLAGLHAVTFNPL